ncbi:MAG: hypothetical protein AAF913_18120 [Pseudomonadota bacterium]
MKSWAPPQMILVLEFNRWDILRDMLMKLAVLLGIAAGLASATWADAPGVPSDPPYIVLSDNHDEPNGYGFCIDTFGPGQSDLLQTHSCKPARAGEPRGFAGNDTRFEYDVATMQIISYPFEGHCMQVLLARGRTEFALLPCSDHSRQKFVYDAADRSLRLHEDQSLCVTVSETTEPAGPWVKRALRVTACAETEAALMQWTVVAE